MTTNPKLESYLTKLEKILAPFPVSDRAEIVMEIKSHVMAAIDRDPATNVESVLSALGEPDTVANRYLIERGLKPTKPSLSPILKWIVIGFLGTFAMTILLVGVVLFRFSPVIHVDDQKNTVSLLGGAIQVDGKNGDFRLNGDFSDFDNSGVRDAGTVTTKLGDEIVIHFSNGKMEVGNSEGDHFSWDCQGPHRAEKPVSIKKSDAPLELDLTNWSGSKCSFQIPRGTHLVMKGANGKVQISEPHYHIDLALLNGKVSLSPDEEEKYQFDTSVLNGKSERFESSSDPAAYKIKLQITNGKLSKD